MPRHRLPLYSSLLFAPVLSAQLSFDLPLLENLPDTTSRIVAGRFSGKALPDLATMSADGDVQAVFQPKTWKLPYDLRVVGAKDMACVQRAAPHEDRLLIVGGGVPRLSKFVPGYGYELVNLDVTGWSQVERVAVGSAVAGYRVAGYKSSNGQLRFGELDPTEMDESLITLNVQTLAHPVLDMLFADWDDDLSKHELLVLTTNGILVYDSTGGAPRSDGPAPFSVAEGHLGRVSVGSRRVVWVYRSGSTQDWQCQAGSSSGVVSVALPTQIGCKPIGAVAASATMARNELLVTLDNAPPAIPEALVLLFPVVGAATVDWVSPEPPSGVNCAEYVDLDGDLEADGIWPIVGVKALRATRPNATTAADAERTSYLASFEEKGPPGTVDLYFSFDGDAVVSVRAFRQDNVDVWLDPVGVLSSASLSGGGSMNVGLPPSPDHQSIYYLEIEIAFESGEIAALFCPYVYGTLAAGPVDHRITYVQNRILQEGSGELRHVQVQDPRRISVIKRPLDYDILPPLSPLPPPPPPTAD